MLERVSDIPTQSFNGGLNTNSNIFSLKPGQSPDMVNVRVNFDGSIEKRLGSNSQNSIILSSAAVVTFDSGAASLTDGLIAYWDMNETSAVRVDAVGNNNLDDNNGVGNNVGILVNAAEFVRTDSDNLSVSHGSDMSLGDFEFTVSTWFYLNTTGHHIIWSKATIDVPDPFTSLLIESEGDNNSQNIVDRSSNNLVITVSADTKKDTGQSNNYASSIIFDGTGDFLELAGINAWHLGTGTGDFTIDFGARFIDLETTKQFCGQFADSGNHWFLSFDTGEGALFFRSRTDNSNTINMTFAWVPLIDTWYHVALVRSDNIFKAYIDGTQIGSNISETDVIPNMSVDLNTPLRIARADTESTDQLFHGYMEDFRISSSARYTENFDTPPAGLLQIGTDYSAYTEVDRDNTASFFISANGTSQTASRRMTTLSIATATWYNMVCFHNATSNLSGFWINSTNATSGAYSSGVSDASAPFIVGGFVGGDQSFDGRIDETGFWKKKVTDTEMRDLYNAGNSLTISPAFGTDIWGSFDFGASNIRWVVYAAATGLYASSDLGVTFTNIATDRTATYQHFERSQGFMIATSDEYDSPLRWDGSGGTFAANLSVGSAPNARFAINHQGFLILMNTAARKRSFFYEDVATQLTGDWADVFDLPSTQDDEITGGIVLRKNLYVSTRNKIFRLSFVGGNPDWSFLEVKAFGFVPRTMRKVTLPDVGEVIVGMSFDRRIRLFDGSDDRIISDNIENFNNMSEFAMSRIPFTGSGLVISHSVLNENTQTYKLCIAIGIDSDQTTSIFNMDARNLAFYPDDNQPWQTMSMFQSANATFLMAGDRSGYVYLLNSGNLDKGVNAIDDHYDSNFISQKSPSEVSKAHKIDFYFDVTSSGTLVFQDRIDFNNSYATREMFSFAETGDLVQIKHSADLPSTQNVFQWRITSSSNQADPWRLNRADYFMKGHGIGINP